jgi:hypothetical protein
MSTGPIDRRWLERQPELRTETRDDNVDLDSLPKCPACGYIVYKLTEARCPECGTPVGAVNLHDAYQEQKLAHEARSERRLRIFGVLALACGAGMFGYTVATSPDWATYTCLTGPLAGTSIAFLGRQIYLRESAHYALAIFGGLWLLQGVLCVLGEVFGTPW